MTNNYHSSDIKATNSLPVQSVYVVGGATLALLDDSIVKKLGVNEDTFFQQELIDDGIVLHLFRDDCMSRHQS